VEYDERWGNIPSSNVIKVRPSGTLTNSQHQASPAIMTSELPRTPEPAPTPAIPTVTYEQFAQLDLRVAEILEAREHPNANKLLLLKIRVGDLEKQIVAGIRGHYEPAQLIGKQIVIVNNLAPAMIRGEESNGMLLAASDSQSVVLLQPEKPIAAGSKVK
jgi:tRNA-binding protein